MHRLSNYKRLVFSILGIILAFSILELGSYVLLRFFTISGVVRANRDGSSLFHAYLGWESPKNTASLTTKDCDTHDKWITTDEYGRSITPLSLKTPTVRIAVLGGSTIFGVGASDNRFTVPSLLEQVIYEKLNIPVEVFNLGVRGYASFQEMLALHTFLFENRVDLVLVIDGRNDAVAGTFNQGRQFALKSERLHDVEEFVRRVQKGDLVVSGVSNTVRSLSLTAEMFERVADKFRRARLEASDGDVPDFIPTFDNIDERVSLTTKHYALMDTTAKLSGAQFVAFLQPTPFTKRKLSEAEIACIEGPGVENSVRRAREQEKRYQQKFYERLRSVDKSFTFVDLSNALDQMQSPAYVDTTHYNDAGALGVAQAVVEEIEPIVRKFSGALPH